MIYATYQSQDHIWEPVEEFVDLKDAMEVLSFFAKDRPWVISNKYRGLQDMVTAREREILATEVEESLRLDSIKTQQPGLPPKTT